MVASSAAGAEGLGVVVSRRFGIVVLAAVGGVVVVGMVIAFVQYGRGAVDWPWAATSFVAMLVVVGFVGCVLTPQRAVFASVAAALIVVVPVTIAAGLPLSMVMLAVVHVVAAVAFGQLLRAGRLARAVARREAERRVVWQERARIAREMHDVLAHRLSLITVLAEAAAVEFTDIDIAVQDRFEVLRSTAAQGLREMRTVLGVLRDEGRAPRRPVPGLGSIATLLEEHRRAGLDVRASTATIDEWSARSETGFPAGVEVAVYRTLQEALSNAARYGVRGGPVDVDFIDGHAELLLRVANPVPPTRAERVGDAGWGLRGMRERVEAVGGVVTAEPCADARFAVTARFPVARSAR